MADDLGGWLARVRPHADADDGFADSPAGRELLRSARGGSAPARPTGRRWVPVGVLAATAAVGVAAALTVSAVAPAPVRPATSAPQVVRARPAAQVLTAYDSCPSLLADLRSHTAAQVGPYGLPGGPAVDFQLAAGAIPGTGAANAATAAGAPGSADATSTTNVQEAGVDEPDVVKTDGDRVVTVLGGTLRVLDARTRTLTGSLDLGAYAGAGTAQLLVAGDSALVLLGGASSGKLGIGTARAYWTPSNTGTTVVFVDLSGQPRVTGSLHSSASYLDARMVGTTVRLVEQSAPRITFPTATSGTDAQRTAANRAVVAAAPLSAWLPSYTLTAPTGTTTGAVPCDEVSHPASYTGSSVVSVLTIDATDPAADPRPVALVADGDTAYASTTSLYVTSSAWSAATTDVHRFDITGTGAPTYLGSGSVSGRPIGPYALSEQAGSLRVATTTLGADGGTAANQLTVLAADTLAPRGQVGGIAPGEQIYAVRYVGDVAYLVTFERVDPLFVIDLHDPARPVVAGRLTVSGYSTYLQDVGNGYVAGVGQDVGTDREPAGTQVSLFDVRRPTAPTRVAEVHDGTAGGGAVDPHAVLFWAPTGLLAVPETSWDVGQSGRVLVLRVGAGTLTKVGLLANPATSAGDGQGIRRTLLVDGAIWTVSADGVLVSDQASLAKRAFVAFG